MNNNFIAVAEYHCPFQGMLKRYSCPLKSYALKSMLLWCMEEQPKHPDFWSDSESLPDIFLHLLQEFMKIINEGEPILILLWKTVGKLFKNH